MRLVDARSHVSADQWALVAIAAAVLLANLAYLLGFFDPNPLDFRSGLASSITPGWLPGRPTIDPSNGFTSQAIGHLAALDLLHLRLPWWNPYEGTGMPLLGETQAAALFPPTLLTLVSGGQLFEHMLLEFVAGACTYLLLRRLRVGRAAAVAGAIAFALNGRFAWFADATVNPLPFLPMLLLGIERAYSAAQEGRRGGWWLMALAGALSVYAGFPEVTYIDTLMAVCWFAWRCGCLERTARRPFVVKALLGLVAGTLLAGPMLLAMGTYLSHADLVTHTGALFGRRHLSPSALPQLLLPYVYGQVNLDPRSSIWVMVGGYLSATLLLLAALALVARERRGLKLVLAGWALLVFARMYGFPPVLGHVLGVLPGMSKIQFYRYATPSLELSVILLAALGLDDLARAPTIRRRIALAGFGMVGTVIVAAVYARPVVRSLGQHLHHDAYFRLAVVWGVLTVVALIAAGFIGAPRLRGRALAFVVAVDALVLFVVPEFAAPRTARVDLAPVSYLRAHLGEGRFFTLGPIQPDYGSYFRLASLGVDDFPPKVYAAFVRARIDPAAPFIGYRAASQPSPEWELMHHLRGYRFAAVRYVLAPASDQLPQSPGALQLVFRSPSSSIYRLAGASAYFAARGCHVTSTDRESASVVCRRPATLIRRETWESGWSGQLDGHSTPIRRYDGLFQAVRVPAGSHRVTFAFAPPDIGWTVLGLLAGCLLMLAPLAHGRLRARQARSA